MVQPNQSSELRAFVLQKEAFVLVDQRAVVSTDTDFLHDHVGVAVTTDGDLISAQPDEEDRETFGLVFKIDALEDSVGWIGGMFHVEEGVFSGLVGELSLVVLLAELTLGLLI